VRTTVELILPPRVGRPVGGHTLVPARRLGMRSRSPASRGLL